MSGSKGWPPASAVIPSSGSLLTNASSSRLAHSGSISNGAECQQLDNEQLYVSMSTFWYCFLAFITMLGLLVSLVSNTIIIYLFTKTPSLRRNPSNIIAVNLSLSDLLYCIQWPSVIYCSLTQSTWMLEIDLLCQTFGFLTVSTAWASILTVVAMSVERAIVIGYSVHAKSRFTIRCAWLIVVLIWIVSICSSLPPLFGKFNRYTLDPSKTSCTLDYLSSKTNYKLYILVLYIAYWITPAIVITICYVAIIVTFKRSSRSLKLVGECSTTTTTAPSETLASQLDNDLSTISGTLSQPVTRQSSPLGWDFARRGGRPLREFKLSRRWLRDSIRLHNLASSFRVRRRAPSGDQNSTGSATVVEPQMALAANQLEWRTSGSSSRIQMPGAPEREPPIVGAGGMEKKVNLIQSAGARITPPKVGHESRDWMQIVAEPLATSDERSPLNCQDVTSADHLTGLATSSGVTSQTRGRPSDNESSGADKNSRQVSELTADSRRRYSSSRLSNLAATVAARRNRPDSLDESDTFKDTFVQVTAGPQVAPSNEHVGRHRVGIRRSRTSQDLRAGKPAAHGRTSDATAILGLNRSSSHLRLQSHKFTATISALVGGSRQATPRPSQQRHTLGSAWSSSCHIGTSGAHLSRTGLQIRLAKMAFYLILLWFISWTPIASLAMIHSVFKCYHRTSALAVFTANTMTKLGPAFDVFIYGISHPIIKSKFKKIIKWIFMVGQSGEKASKTSRRPIERSRQVSTRSNFTSQERRHA